MAVSAAELQQLYLAYFGRPADPGGLAYYTGQANLSIWDVANAFSASPESHALYGSSFGAITVQAIYHNLFNRDAEPAGLLYWTQQVASGSLSAAGAALGILLGAQNDDKAAVRNKLTFADAFTSAIKTDAQISGYAGDAAVQAARILLSEVSSDPSSIATAGHDIVRVIPIRVGDPTTSGFTVSDMPSGGTLVITADAQSDTVNMADATAGTGILHIELSKSGAITGASVTASQAGSISIAANDTSTGVQPGSHVDSLALAAEHATSLTISGNAALQLTAGTSVNLATIDASAMTGWLTYATLAGATQHVTGGAGNDTIESKGTLDVLTGGGGNDTFVVGAAANPNSYATITDASPGDIVALANAGGGTATFSRAPITLAATAVFQDYANAAADAGGDASGHPALAWFVYQGDTYLVASEHNASVTPGFASAADVIVKLAGLHDLAAASINSTPGAAVLVQINPSASAS